MGTPQSCKCISVLGHFCRTVELPGLYTQVEVQILKMRLADSNVFTSNIAATQLIDELVCDVMYET